MIKFRKNNNQIDIYNTLSEPRDTLPIGHIKWAEMGDETSGYLIVLFNDTDEGCLTFTPEDILRINEYLQNLKEA